MADGDPTKSKWLVYTQKMFRRKNAGNVETIVFMHVSFCIFCKFIFSPEHRLCVFGQTSAASTIYLQNNKNELKSRARVRSESIQNVKMIKAKLPSSPFT